jgi:hypothetical protein
MSKSTADAVAAISPTLSGVRNHPELFDEDTAAKFLGGLSPTTLATWRCTHRYKLAYVKIGHRVFYRRDDLEAWLESRRVTK